MEGKWRANFEGVSYRSAVAHAIGGGWGKGEHQADSIPVRVIRGTDFKNIRSGSFELVPLRFEKPSRVKSRRLEVGDIILEISGGSPSSKQSTGRSLLVTQPLLEQLGNVVIPASFCRLIRVDRALVDPRYVYYSLQHMYNSGRAALYEIQSTGLSNFQFNHFLDEEILLLPPLPEQRAIAQILGTLDDKIELNRRMNETLEAMARALFKSWFVDYEPVRAKMDGRDTGLPPHIAALSPDRLVPSELGEIPAGWEVTCLSEIATAPIRSIDPNHIRKDTPYIELQHMPRRSISLEEWEYSEMVSSNKSVFRKGEFLLAKAIGHIFTKLALQH